MDASVALTLDGTPFDQTLNKSESRAKTFGQRLRGLLGGGGGGNAAWDEFVSGGKKAETAMNRVSRNFSGMFKRDPGQRAENAMVNLLGDISAGNLAGGFAQFASSVTAGGLVIGVAIGAAALAFQKFRRDIKETREAGVALRVELGKPISIITSLDSSGMSEALQARQKLADTLREKSEKKFGSELSEAFQSTLSGPTFGAISGEKSGEERLNIEKDLTREHVDRKAILLAQANQAQQLVAIKREELFGDESLARVKKIQLETDQARAKLRLTPGLTKEAFNIADNSILQNEELSLKTEGKRKTAKERSLEVEEKIARLERSGLTPEKQKQIKTAIELQGIDQRIKEATSPQERREIGLEKIKKENELRAMTAPQQRRNPFAEGTVSSRRFDEDQGFGSIAERQREMNDPRVYGSLAYNAAQRGDIPKPQDRQQTGDVASLLQTLIEITKQVWVAP